MRRIFLIASIVTAIFACWAIPAFACVQSKPAVCAPSSHANDNAADSKTRAQLPDNDGTQKAKDNSPAIEDQQSPVGSSCNPN